MGYPARSVLLFFFPLLLVMAVAISEPSMKVAQSHLAAAQDVPPDCQCAPASNITRVRKNIDCLTEQELRNFEHAFKVLQDRSAANSNDKSGYDYHVRIHGDRMVGPCNHLTELIWPWHRAFLYYFEDLLRASDPNNADTPTKDVTLAYWDWTKLPSGTSGYPRAFENPNSPLFHAGRNPWGGVNPPPPVFTDADVGLSQSDWYLFGGSAFGPWQSAMSQCTVTLASCATTPPQVAKAQFFILFLPLRDRLPR
jgi:Common central domain of tyrosinase